MRGQGAEEGGQRLGVVEGANRCLGELGAGGFSGGDGVVGCFIARGGGVWCASVLDLGPGVAGPGVFGGGVFGGGVRWGVVGGFGGSGLGGFLLGGGQGGRRDEGEEEKRCKQF